MTESTKTIIAVSVVGALFAGLICFFFIPYDKPFQIVHSFWQTQTDRRQKTLAHKAHWGRPRESSAFNVDCEERFYGWEDCYCTADDSGFETCMSCKEYETWCSYDYYAWPVIETLIRSGEPEETPTWPEMVAEVDQRIDHTARYEVLFHDEEKHPTDFDARGVENLRRFKVGEWWMVKVTHGGKFEPLARLIGEKD